MVIGVEELRHEFDSSFARPARSSQKDNLAFLAVLVGGRPYAIDIRELGGLVVDQKTTRVPSSSQALVGIGAHRGQALAVFDLAQLLGVSNGSQMPRWTALSKGADPIGFAFGELEGHLRPRSADLAPLATKEGKLVERVLKSEVGHRPIVSIEAAVRLVLGGHAQKQKETMPK